MSISQKLYFPRAELSEYIESYQVVSSIGEDPSVSTVEVYPRTALDMVFIFNGSIKINTKNRKQFELFNYALVGMLDKKYHIEFSKNIYAIHVRFKQHGIYPLTNLTLKDSWLNQINLDELLNTDVGHLYNNIGNEPCVLRKINLLEEYLVVRYRKAKIHHKFNYCLDLINNTKSIIKVSQLASSVNSNYKSLDRWFQKYIGTNPKKYLQLHRFKTILDQLENDKDVDWMGLVVDYGFHDQAHFIHQFKAIADKTPSAYLQNKASVFTL